MVKIERSFSKSRFYHKEEVEGVSQNKKQKHKESKNEEHQSEK